MKDNDNEITPLIKKMSSWGHAKVQSKMQQTIYDNKINKSIRCIFRTQ